MPYFYQLLTDSLGLAPFWATLIAVVVPVLLIHAVIQGVAGASTYVERKIAADIQRRVGPNKCNPNVFLGDFVRGWVESVKDKRAGFITKMVAVPLRLSLPLFRLLDKILPPGILIFLADGIKLIMKEDIIPDAVDKPLFKIAPALVLAAAFGALATLPYSDKWYIADYNIGIFSIAAVTSVEVLGILMAGWASNNKWALLGGMRSAAQIVSYELPVGLAILTGITISGTLSMQGMTYDQLGLTDTAGSWNSGWFWQWNVFHPAMFILFPVYFLAALAECNRTPFDIPEAESELVSGYHTEYSGMRFGFFFIGEYVMMCVTSAIATTLFLGGWTTGIAPLEHLFMTHDAQFVNGVMTQAPEYHWLGTILHLGAFCAKTYFLVFIMMWIRWTLPRFRVDQMMTLCWKKLIPLGMLCLSGVCVWQLVRMYILAQGGGGALGALTFWLRCFFSIGVLGGLYWYFAKPLSKVQVDQREMLSRSHMNTGAV